VAVHLKLVFNRSTIAAEDVAVCTFDLEGPDVDATTADTIENSFENWWGLIRPGIAAQLSLSQFRFYNGYNGDGSPGQADQIITVNLPGLNTTGMLPPQCSCSVTEELYSGGTSAIVERRHWGRFYLPGIAKDQTGPDGRFIGPFVTGVADHTKALYDGLATLGWEPSIWIKPQGSASHVLAAVNGIRVDDIVDIIRRRRWDTFVVRELRDLAGSQG
jgi:hypothetical protein